MAAFSSGNLPASINTWEKLLLLAFLCLRSVIGNREVSIPQADNTLINRKILESTTFVDNAGTVRYAITAYIPIPPDWESTAGKLHTKVIEIVTATVGSSFYSD